MCYVRFFNVVVQVITQVSEMKLPVSACSNFDVDVFFCKDEVLGVTRLVCWEENVLSEA